MRVELLERHAVRARPWRSCRGLVTPKEAVVHQDVSSNRFHTSSTIAASLRDSQNARSVGSPSKSPQSSCRISKLPGRADGQPCANRLRWNRCSLLSRRSHSRWRAHRPSVSARSARRASSRARSADRDWIAIHRALSLGPATLSPRTPKPMDKPTRDGSAALTSRSTRLAYRCRDRPRRF